MKKRIYLNMMILSSVTLLLMSLLLCIVFYNQFSGNVRAEIRAQAETFRHAAHEDALAALSDVAPAQMRITLVAPDGAVVYDNAASADTMPDHSDREEIRRAASVGFGESKRYSDTIGTETCYYAVAMRDGYFLRTARTTQSIFAVFGRALPFVAVLFALSLAIGYLLATRLTRRVVRPINDFDFDGDFEAPYDELVPFVRAIDMQRQQISVQMRELRERSDTIHSIMENMNEGAVLLGEGGTILSVNRSATALFGVEGDLTGHDVHELFRDGRLLDLTKEALSGQRREMDMPRAGQEYHVFFSPVPPDGAILLFLDVTERLRAERLRREFSANVSHELKTPLTSITGYAEMLVNGMAKDGDRADFAMRIRDEAWRMISLVEDIMLLSHLDEGVPDAPFEEVDLLGAARAAAGAGSVTMRADGADVRVVVGTPPAAPKATIRANPSMIGELIANLIDNAVKYNHPGGRVDVTAALVEGCAVLRVADTGIGIPPEEQDRVFERFYRVDKSRSKDTGGTGLGLAIVKHIAIIHGAQLTLESELGRGTTIKVAFPAAPDYLPPGK